jgi:uncharacterized protein (UPF0335 family)
MAEATIDIAGAARATGLSVKAIRGRVERGSLPCELVCGRRRIPVRALVEAGLLVTDRSEARAQQRAEVDLPALLDRLERQAEEIGTLRAELTRLRAEVAEPR